jgi:hypothetical protein
MIFNIFKFEKCVIFTFAFLKKRDFCHLPFTTSPQPSQECAILKLDKGEQCKWNWVQLSLIRLIKNETNKPHLKQIKQKIC